MCSYNPDSNNEIEYVNSRLNSISDNKNGNFKEKKSYGKN